VTANPRHRRAVGRTTSVDVVAETHEPAVGIQGKHRIVRTCPIQVCYGPPAFAVHTDVACLVEAIEIRERCASPRDQTVVVAELKRRRTAPSGRSDRSLRSRKDRRWRGGRTALRAGGM
jgi:hypothetical protein